MPAEPVFVADRATLLARLRMEESVLEDHTQFDQALQEVRLFLYTSEQGLGKVLIDQILAIPYVENPTDADGLKRLCANVLEVLLVRRHLLYTMPMLFMDANLEQEAWNEDGFVRSGADRIKDEIDELNLRIQDKLDELQGTPEDAGRASVYVTEPTPPVPYPRSSVNKWYPYA